jgi:hypothetical protein
MVREMGEYSGWVWPLLLHQLGEHHVFSAAARLLRSLAERESYVAQPLHPLRPLSLTEQVPQKLLQLL